MVTPQERASYARRRYNMANRWWQQSPRGAAAQQQPRTRAIAPTRAPLLRGRRMGPNFGPRGARSMVLPTRNRLQPLPRWRPTPNYEEMEPEEYFPLIISPSFAFTRWRSGKAQLDRAGRPV